MTPLLAALLAVAPDARAATLDEVLAAAEAYAPDARTADARADGVEADVRRGRALLGPTLAASASYLVNNYEVVFSGEGGDIVIQPLHYGQAAVSLTQGLSAAAIAAQRAAEASRTAAGADRDSARDALVLAVIGAFYDRLVAQEAVAVQRALLALAESQGALADARATAGMADDRAVLQARLAVSRARRELEAALAADTAAGEALRRFTGRDEASPLVWPDVPSPGAPTATARRDVAAAEARVEAASRRARSAWTLWMPDLAVGATFAWTGNAGFTGRNDLLTGRLDATWVLPVAGAHVHQRAAWGAEARVAEAGLQATVDAVAQQVATARAELDRARAAEAAMADELALAERHHDLTVRAFELGSATALEVDEALAQVRAARLGALRERASVAVATWGVLWAEGRLPR